MALRLERLDVDDLVGLDGGRLGKNAIDQLEGTANELRQLTFDAVRSMPVGGHDDLRGDGSELRRPTIATCAG